MYQCRNCEFRTEAERPCIYVNKLITTINELKQINTDVVQGQKFKIFHYLNKNKERLNVFEG